MRTIDILILGLIVIAFLTLGYFYIQSSNQSYSCIENPLVYYANELSKANNNVSVYGEVHLGKSSSPIIHFNKENISIEYPKENNPMNRQFENLSNFNITFVK